MNTGECWRMLFECWPSSMPRRGLVITTFGESIPFVNYMLSGGIVLLDRDKPDTLGARKVFLAFEAVAAVKITDVVDLPKFEAFGFMSPMQ